MYTGDDNESRFKDMEISLKDAGDIGYLSEHEEVKGIIFRENSSGYYYTWHNAPRRQYIIMLEGAV